LPWARTGRRQRTGIDLVRVSRTLHLATHGPGRLLLLAVTITPIVLAAGWLAWALRRRTAARIAAASTGAVAVVAAIAIASSSMPAAYGAAIGAVLGTLTVALSVRH
jgi:peptidoglycan/LPS O-acetylase OafA/YrhL